jgi:oligopeptide/dipeptide ABC transporter ATP-binding protein
VILRAEHPYTRGLMGSIPTLTQESDRLVQIPGAMPRLTNAIPRGCAFNPRCEHAFDRCRTDRPDPIDRPGNRRWPAGCMRRRPPMADPLIRVETSGAGSTCRNPG